MQIVIKLDLSSCPDWKIWWGSSAENHFKNSFKESIKAAAEEAQQQLKSRINEMIREWEGPPPG